MFSTISGVAERRYENDPCLRRTQWRRPCIKNYGNHLTISSKGSLFAAERAGIGGLNILEGTGGEHQEIGRHLEAQSKVNTTLDD